MGKKGRWRETIREDGGGLDAQEKKDEEEKNGNGAEQGGK